MSQKKENNYNQFTVVGIAMFNHDKKILQKLFSPIPENVQMAFIIIHPNRERISETIATLSQSTKLKTSAIVKEETLQPGFIYVTTTDNALAIDNNIFNISAIPAKEPPFLSIDIFFRSLAQSLREKAIGILLSGFDNSCIPGFRSIKGNGGLTIINIENKSDHSSNNDIVNTEGCADFMLPLTAIPKKILELNSHPYQSIRLSEAEQMEEDHKIIFEILQIIKHKTGHDFFNYKIDTIYRRIARRMAINKVHTLLNYKSILISDENEAERLFNDFLIGVTSFFRDPEAFSTLFKKVIHTVISKKDHRSTFRVWVPCCSTGEEAYSLAILAAEALDKLKQHKIDIQVFATDIDEDAINTARLGIYPESIKNHVSQNRLERFFQHIGNQYKVKKILRQHLTFAIQNIAMDPPFSKLDLISCRNFMIYTNTALQKKILSYFNYALNEGGYLFLGSAETIVDSYDLFTPIDNRWKIYQHKKNHLPLKIQYPIPVHDDTQRYLRKPNKKAITREKSLQNLIEEILLNDYSPACVLLNEKHQILYLHGPIERYTKSFSGGPIFNILDIINEDIKHHVTTALITASNNKKSEIYHNIKTISENQIIFFDMIVRMVNVSGYSQTCILILFNENPGYTIDITPEHASSIDNDNLRVSSLEQELLCTKEYLKTTIDALEMANEELRHTNEELQSANEELKSINEELSTSQEEIQSTNEELLTLNTELHTKVDELFQANSDINNMFASTDIGTLFLDKNLCIRRFTPSIGKFIHIIPGDIGRPIHDLNLKFDFDDLLQDIKLILVSQQSRETTFNIKNKQWYSLRIMPYTSLTGETDGVVLTFVDVTHIKQQEIYQKQLAELINLTYDSIMICDMQHTITLWNQGSTVQYGWTMNDALGKTSTSLLKTKYPCSLTQLMKELTQHSTWKGELTNTTKDGAKIIVSSRWSLQYDDKGTPIAILKIDTDITLEKMLKDELSQDNKKLAEVVKERTFDLKLANIQLKNEITKQKKAEQTIQQSLEEKELLLREIYHRTKNNMQVISSILSLQSRQLPDNCGMVEPIFQDLIGRIKSMSLVHEKLYQAKDLSNINLKEYTLDLLNILSQNYNIKSTPVTIKTNLADVYVSIDTAIPYSMVVNELISNALKYAFPTGTDGQITVSLQQSLKKTITLSISDNGIGLPKNFNIETISSLGLTLFRQIVKNQLLGTFSIKTKPKIKKGCEFSIRFKEIPYKRRI